ncbi:hypothetical protein PIB30_006443 [Stylosanthes scabra]|uniref:Membrane protein of ER body-like protein n=1 Tax=Stylosanthes scabra TaxID=79078 RepID=A0ABU6U4I1_9FABA|nr:hypothetical protein [Stylosanthes scabra]
MEVLAQKEPLLVIDTHRKKVVFGDDKAPLQFNITTSAITNGDEVDTTTKASDATYNTNKFPIIGEGVSLPQEEGISGIKDKNWLPISDCSSSSSSYHVKNLHEDKATEEEENEEPIGIAISTTEKVREIYLKKIYILPPNHEFYCPRCEVCIDKVILCKTGKGTSQVTDEQSREWFSGILPVSRPPALAGPTPTSNPERDPSVVIPVIPDEPTRPENKAIRRSNNNKGWEVLKSFVYGGLHELLASLSLVTSSASADANTLNIVALAIANIIGGLVLLIHNIRDLKNTQPREEETETEVPIDKYYETLGKRDHFYLHTFVAVLSFLIFGLLPPVVYGFSFRESDDKDLKLAAVAGASLIGMTLLALAKAHTQRRPNSSRYVIYLTTVSYYVTSGVLASLLTYVAGAAVKRLVEQLGWFEPQPTINGGIVNGMSFPIGKNQGLSYY